jgi:hypothetical protein
MVNRNATNVFLISVESILWEAGYWERVSSHSRKCSTERSDQNFTDKCL